MSFACKYGSKRLNQACEVGFDDLEGQHVRSLLATFAKDKGFKEDKCGYDDDEGLFCSAKPKGH